MLARSYKGDALWLASTRLGPMSDQMIRLALVTTTKERLGHAVSPHGFRDALVNDLLDHDPTALWVATEVLHHTTARTTRENYGTKSAGTAAVRIAQRVRADLLRDLAQDRTGRGGAPQRQIPCPTDPDPEGIR